MYYSVLSYLRFDKEDYLLSFKKSPLFYKTTSEAMGQCLQWEVKVMASVGVGQEAE